MARGQSEKVLWELLTLVLIAILAVVILFAIDRALGGESANEDQASEYAFLSLSQVIRSFAQDAAPYKVTGWSGDGSPIEPHIPIYLAKSFSMVGFGKEDKTAIGSCSKVGGSAVITKPNACGNDACLCFYKSESIQASTVSSAQLPGVTIQVPDPLSCVSFDDVDYLLSYSYYDFATNQATYIPTIRYDIAAIQAQKRLTLLGTSYSAQNLVGGGYASLFIYGTCANFADGASMGTQSLSVEKIVANGKTALVIAYPEPDYRVLEARKRKVESSAQLSAKILADKAFLAGDFGTATKLYVQALQGSSLQSGSQQEVVLKLAESSYRLAQIPGATQQENKSKAADFALNAIAQYGLPEYMRSLQQLSVETMNHAIVTLMPLPEVTPSENGFESPPLDTQVSVAAQRFQLLSEGKPADDLLAYLSAKTALEFAITQGSSTVVAAIPQLERALSLAGTQVPKSIIWYDLGYAQYIKFTSTSGSEAALAVQKMFDAYVNAAVAPERAELVEMHNRAQNTLADQCFYQKDKISICAKIPGIGGRPIAGGDCSTLVGSRCATLTQDQLHNVYIGQPMGSWDRFTCVNTKWVADTSCPKYCIDGYGATFTADCVDHV